MPRKRKPLTFDFSSLDFSIPAFAPDEEARPINKLSPVPVSDENAEALARHIDWQRDYIALVSGAFVFGDFLELLLYVHDLQPTAVYITTLGMSENNADSIVNMTDYLGAEKVNLIASHYFEGVERHKLVPYLEREFSGRPIDIAVLQSHCKICLIRSPKGDGVICGSANLSSSNNVEQFTIMHDPAAISYLQARLDNVMERFTVFRGLAGESDHRRKRNTDRDAYIAMMSDKMGGAERSSLKALLGFLKGWFHNGKR